MTQQQNQQTQQGAAAEQGAGTEQEGGDALEQLETALGEEGDGEGGQGAEEWKAPTKEEWEAAQSALEAERGKLKRAREQAKRLREGTKAGAAAIEAETGTGGAGTGGEAAPDPRIVAMQARVVRAAAREQLKDRGANPDFVDLVLGGLDPAAVDFTEDDEPDLDEWLDQVAEKHPAVFAKPADGGTRRPAGGVDQGRGSGAGAAKKLSYGETVLANARRAQMGRGRR